MKLSIIVPTFNEAPNIEELVGRIQAACGDIEAEIVFVDDSKDDTPDVILRVSGISTMPVRLIHREHPDGGLGGAVIEGMRSSDAEYCLVMDGDLQHPPEMIPTIVARLQEGAADVVVASRYCGAGGDAGGLANAARKLVSSGSTALTRSLFPIRLRQCTDPMTGFFGFRTSAVAVDDLRPNGFKILLEILARQRLDVVEVPFVFGTRLAGESKASFREGLRFVQQLSGLRFGRIASFGMVGGIGAMLNLLIMAILIALGTHYVAAAIVAAELTIISNFLMQERLVFHASRIDAAPLSTRFLQSFSFNNVDAIARLPFLWILVEMFAIGAIVAQAGTLLVAFLVRYLFHSRVVYRPRVLPVQPLAVTRPHGRRRAGVPVPSSTGSVQTALSE